MAAPRVKQTQVRTALAQWRVKRGMTQQEVWEAAGMSRVTYIAIEQGRNTNPQVRWLVNLSVVLGCSIEELLGPDLREWYKRYEGDADPPPDPAALWHGRPAKERRAREHAELKREMARQTERELRLPSSDG